MNIRAYFLTTLLLSLFNQTALGAPHRSDYERQDIERESLEISNSQRVISRAKSAAHDERVISQAAKLSTDSENDSECDFQCKSVANDLERAVRQGEKTFRTTEMSPEQVVKMITTALHSMTLGQAIDKLIIQQEVTTKDNNVFTAKREVTSFARPLKFLKSLLMPNFGHVNKGQLVFTREELSDVQIKALQNFSVKAKSPLLTGDRITVVSF